MRIFSITQKVLFLLDLQRFLIRVSKKILTLGEWCRAQAIKIVEAWEV